MRLPFRYSLTLQAALIEVYNYAEIVNFKSCAVMSLVKATVEHL